MVHPNTQEYLEDPIWDALQVNTRFNMIVGACIETHWSKEDFEEYQYTRHVLVEEGQHTVGALAWQTCRQLRLVKLPASVARVEECAFRRCHLLNRVEAPGCVLFGARVFAECGSLQHLLASGGDNILEGSTQLAPYLSEDCVNLGRLTLTQAVMDADQTTREKTAEFRFCTSKVRHGEKGELRQSAIGATNSSWSCCQYSGERHCATGLLADRPNHKRLMKQVLKLFCSFLL